MSVEDPGRDGAAGRRPAGSSAPPAAGSCPTIRTSRSRRSALRRPRLQPSRLPRAGPGPGALPQPLRRGSPAAAAQALRMNGTRQAGAAGMPRPADDQGRRRPRGPHRRGIFTRRSAAAQHGDVLVVAQKIVSKAEGRCSTRRRRALGARGRLAASRQGPATGRGDPVGIDARGALAAERADRRAPARLRHGQCRHRPVQRRRRRTASSARCCCRRDPDGSAEALRARLGARLRRRTRRGHHRQLRPAWRRGTAGIAIGAAGLPALLDLRGKPDLFGRTLRGQHLGLRRRDRGRRFAGHGPGRRGAAGRPGARACLDGARRPGRGSWCGPPQEDLFR